MLVKVIDHKGKACWVNPGYVRAVREKGDGKSTIDVSGWTVPIVVAQPMDDVAGLLSIALERLGRTATEIAERSSTTATPTDDELVTSLIVIGG